MSVDKYEDLPAILSELQDGNLEIFEENTAPSVLVLGTASKGVAEKQVQVVRAQEEENRFGKTGTLARGMYEALSGGAQNLYVERIGARSAILFGIGTDDMGANPTSIETLLKDKDAADLYLVRYMTPATLGPNAKLGHLQIKNALGVLVYDNNPGGQSLDAGEVTVSGEFIGGSDIGNVADPEDFVSLRDIAMDKIADSATFAAEAVAVGTYDLGVEPNAGTVLVKLDGEEIANTAFTVVGMDVILNDSTIADNKEVVIDFEKDADAAHNLRDGADGDALSQMELYEALDQAYERLEATEFDFIVPMGIALDAANVEDGDMIVLSADEKIPAGMRYPVAGEKGDALGKIFKEEYDGEFFYFWDIDGDGQAEIFPSVGAASATTKINGEVFEAGDFKEVNFGYQLANFCYTASSNEFNVLGVIGARLPKSFSTKDISRWVGKEPQYDTDGVMIADGTGLAGNKFTAGKVNHKKGFFATSDGHYQGASGEASGAVEVDRGGKPVDIGRYLSIYAMPMTFFNNIDETGFGYTATGAAYYAGFVSTLAVQFAPTNKVAPRSATPFKLSKAKLNTLTKYRMVSIKEKNGVLRFTDAPTASRKVSDYNRLTHIRVVNDCVDAVREVGTPYIGGPNTPVSRSSLEKAIIEQLELRQKAGVIQRFEIKISATQKQSIEGDAIVELVIVPPYELRKIRVITTLAKQ